MHCEDIYRRLLSGSQQSREVQAVQVTAMAATSGRVILLHPPSPLKRSRTPRIRMWEAVPRPPAPQATRSSSKESTNRSPGAPGSDLKLVLLLAVVTSNASR